ncbi:TetR/AcrR family transcriptional regulator [Lentilactobacillus kisonensis]|uniref:Transcriptional regulator, TetR family n=2 Tax=Lentilactobacillus kisonensis TaxID=481722 RepID=H1LJ95_9LACO|nr:TetR/AcrR family transcriptional regulator [Lentilactobacillus kisonensis]EHO48912.1 transcriptional regulator, TetR family [Lentilactobacillus kisonensis F0435]KRL23041.1 transcriptional regulator, TetR family [Lentilactobacillus kisonensis DSM 19906 = JCM 15041]
MVNRNIKALFNESIDQSNLSTKQQAVLKASLELFSEQGFDRTSTKDIADRAAVSEGTVYKQFKTKEGILAAILDPFIHKVLPKAVTEFMVDMSENASPDIDAFLTYVIRNRMQFAMDNRLQIRILLQEATRNSSLLNFVGSEIGNIINSPLGDSLRKYQTTGQLVKWPLARIIQYIFATVLSYVLPKVLDGGDLDVEQASHETVTFILDGLKPQG